MDNVKKSMKRIMSDKGSNSGNITRNTLMLYIRMLFLMLIGLYTSRVNLAALGIDDYGIYNVVGGVVGMFSILSSSLSAAISRFLTFELGKGIPDNVRTVFSSAVTIQLLLSVIVLILAESIGLWFLNGQMNIPNDRIYAANWVYQISVATFIVSLISVPYNATIIAHEKMSVFAYISIFEGVGKLAVAFLITVSPIDRLIFFSTLLLVISIIVRLIYGVYCGRHFAECNFRLRFDSGLLWQMFGFAGWNFIGSSAAILRDQGGNILLNIFFGPAVNAARGISLQVSNAVIGFVNNFMTALNPQITKSYASENKNYMMFLIFQGARFSYYLLLLLALPILLNMNTILSLWLKDVPEHTAIFTCLTLAFALSESISNPLITAMLATGNIRNYQLIVGGLQMLNVPIAYFGLKLGMQPEWVLIVTVVISQCCLAARLAMLRKMIGLSVRRYLRCVYLNALEVSVAAAIIPILVFEFMPEGILKLVISSFLSVACTCISILYIGCNCEDRARLKAIAGKIVAKVRYQ